MSIQCSVCSCAQLHTSILCLSQALEAAGIAIEKDHIDNVDKMRAGILIGTAMGGMATFAQAIEDLTQKVPVRIDSHVTAVQSCILSVEARFLTQDVQCS